jgi:hypothetical protein
VSFGSKFRRVDGVERSSGTTTSAESLKPGKEMLSTYQVVNGLVPVTVAQPMPLKRVGCNSPLGYSSVSS